MNLKDFTYIVLKTSNMIYIHCGCMFKSKNIANKEGVAYKIQDSNHLCMVGKSLNLKRIWGKDC